MRQLDLLQPCGYVFLLLAFACTPALAQRSQPLSVKELKPNIYVVQGAGGNSGVVIGTGGVVVIDAKDSLESGQALVAAVAKLTPKPITHVILTHSDADHVNGLAGFPANVTVIAHGSATSEMEDALAAGGRGVLPRNRLPSKLIARTGETLTLQGVQFDLRHWAPAHTSGDLIVVLPDARIAFTGDLTSTATADPVIRLEKRGSSEGWITAVKGMLGFRVQYVPGHGNPQTGTEVQAILSVVARKRDWVVSLVKEGKSLADIKSTVGDPPSPPPPARPAAPAPPKGRVGTPVPARGPVAPLTFTEAVFQELTRRF